MTDTPIAIDTRAKDEARPSWRRKSGARAKRVNRVVVDHSVFCPRCGDRMQLSHFHTFQCGECGQEIAADDAIKILEAGAAI
jgi:ribosomal protein S27AE